VLGELLFGKEFWAWVRVWNVLVFTALSVMHFLIEIVSRVPFWVEGLLMFDAFHD